MNEIIVTAALLGSGASLFGFLGRLREVNLLRSRIPFLALVISGATFSAWTFIQALVGDSTNLCDIMGCVFCLSYLHVTQQAWSDGAPKYTERDTAFDDGRETLKT